MNPMDPDAGAAGAAGTAGGASAPAAASPAAPGSGAGAPASSMSTTSSISPTSSASSAASAASPPTAASATPDWFALDAGPQPAPLHDVATIRGIEHAGLQSLPPFTLMARAGAAAADWITGHAPPGKLLCLAGPGNNGGDAMVAATRLHQAGRRVEAWLAGTPDHLPPDAARAWTEARTAGVPLLVMPHDPGAPLPPWPAGCAAIVDGLLGIGLNRPAEGQLARWIEHVNRSGLPVFALDIPSGLFADTGAGQPAIRARRTLTFLAAKPGLLTLDGRDCAGEIDIAPLGLPYPTPDLPAARLNQPAGFGAALPGRRHAANKGTFGSLAVIGGHTGMTGAPLLGSRAALFLGAGRVHIGFLARTAPALDVAHPELMLHAVADIAIDAMSALVIGPGMGTDAGAQATLQGLLDACMQAATPPALVLDADALNLLAAHDALATRLIAARLPRVLTPHPLEAARLLGSSVSEVQRDRLAAARALARRWQAVVVLKGSGSVIAAPPAAAHHLDSQDIDAHDIETVTINPTGNAALATAGTGDVLAGMIGALLAQGMPARHAACAAVWIHGRAADCLVAAGTGPAGVTASELYVPARRIFNALLHGAPC